MSAQTTTATTTTATTTATAARSVAVKRGGWSALGAALLLLLAGLVVAGASGCKGTGGGGPVIDERLLLALEEARAWQHRADTHLADSDVSAAIDDVRHVLEIRFPAGTAEGEEARLDAWARLGKLHLAAGDEIAALAAVDRGGREATRDSFYRAHVETVRGEIYEARGKRLDASDATAARAARRAALDAYARSIEINKRVQASLLQEVRP